jgi:hypothetical protein
VIERAVAVRGRHHAERDREHGRQHDGRQRQLGGGRPQVLEHDRQRRAPLLDGEAEVAARDGRDEVEVLRVKRSLETEQVPGVGDLLPGGGLVHEKRGRIPGEPQDEEDDGDDAPDDEDRVNQPPREEPGHCTPVISSTRRRGSPCSAPASA